MGMLFGLLLTIYVNVIIMTVVFLFAIYFKDYMSYDNIREHIREVYGEGGAGQVSRLTLLGYYISSFFSELGFLYAFFSFPIFFFSFLY